MKMMSPASMRAVQRSMAPARRYMSTQQQQSSSTSTHAAAATSEASTSVSLGKWKPGAEIRMLYDGECSLCMKEVKFLQGRDAAAGKIDFVDIAEPSYSPEDNAGITFQAAMERIHAILPDGTIVKDIEVFRRLYEAVGVYGSAGDALARPGQHCHLRHIASAAHVATLPLAQCDAAAAAAVRRKAHPIHHSVLLFFYVGAGQVGGMERLGWVYAITKNKAVEDAGNAVYNVWAKYRTQITGREALDVILARHRAEQEGRTGSLCRDSDGNVTAACDLPGASSSSSSSQ
uniref:Thiol-disulfide oxidoreductase DCC n=1 Tax=Tetradesmus obliquus TaxID=3088 RepID=A0A383VJS5_TETOB|eukprot:jgi/Sobl393_1/14165/SZX65787.1